MPEGIKHALLRKLQLRVNAYNYRIAQNQGPVSALPVIEIAREIAANYQQVRKERNAAHAEYSRKLLADRKAKGLCRVCGKVPPRPDRTSCSDCGRRDVESSRRQYDAMRKRPKREGR